MRTQSIRTKTVQVITATAFITMLFNCVSLFAKDREWSNAEFRCASKILRKELDKGQFSDLEVKSLEISDRGIGVPNMFVMFASKAKTFKFTARDHKKNLFTGAIIIKGSPIGGNNDLYECELAQNDINCQLEYEVPNFAILNKKGEIVEKRFITKRNSELWYDRECWDF